MRSMVEGLSAPAHRPLHHSLCGEWFPSPAFGQGGIQSFAAMNFSTTGAIFSRHLRPLKMP
jgi:hypothetical protein